MPTGLPKEVLNLVIAARVVAYEDQGPGAIKSLDQACEAFSEQVKWCDQPDVGEETEDSKLREKCRKAGLCMTCLTSPPDNYGCSDCLNTGWNGGCPPNSPDDIKRLFSGMINDFADLKKRIETKP